MTHQLLCSYNGKWNHGGGRYLTLSSDIEENTLVTLPHPTLVNNECSL